jgi:hypothetical protein
LLQRHQIRMFQTQPIGRAEQERLIKQRFLKDVQFVDEKRDDMDDVDVYLVLCTGRIADDLYMDLKNRPAGFAGFRLNLTTREAQGGAMQKSYLAAGETPPTNAAFDLMVNFGILSSVGRQLGAFGTIGWVEPSLLNPPPPSPDGEVLDQTGNAGEGAEANGPDEDATVGLRRRRNLRRPAVPQMDAQALQNGDFACELLFVVRKLKPVAPAPAPAR